MDTNTPNRVTENNLSNSHSERGNIFFTLFGAVAVVGVLGAGVMSVMRGPLTTMVEVNRRTQAETQMAINSKIVLLEATEILANQGDCDSDNFVEPLEHGAALAGLTGGGELPSAIASNRLDPWGTPYGYCAWDAGTVIDDAGCDDDTSGTYERLDGDGSAAESYTVLAVISAGPDQTFDTTCTGGATPAITRAANSDDIINSFSYQAATAATGGLWKLKSGDVDTAEIAKNLEVTGGATFSGNLDLTAGTSQLQLGAASMLLPDHTVLVACDAANESLLRIKADVSPNLLQICDDTNDDGAVSGYAWENVGAGAVSGPWTIKSASEIHFGSTGDGYLVGINNANPSEALDIEGNIKLENAGNAEITFTSYGTINGDPLDLKSGDGVTVEISDVFGVTGALAVYAENTFTRLTGATADNTAAALEVRNSTPTSILFVRNDGNVGINDSSPSEALDVNGNTVVSGTIDAGDTINTAENYLIDGAVVLDTSFNTASNIAVGVGAGAAINNASATDNTLIGADAGASITSGANNIMIGSGTEPAAATSSNVLNIGNAVQADLTAKRVGIGFADSYNVSLFDDALEVSGDIDATGDISGTDLYASSEVFVNGDKLAPPPNCTSAQKLEWNDTVGWSCETDLQGGSGGGVPDLNDLDDVDTTGVGDGQCIVYDLGTTTWLAGPCGSSLWTDNTTHITYGSTHIIKAGETVTSSGLGSDGSRVFIHTTKSAMRGGTMADGSANWSEANIGNNSFSWGTKNRASGSNSVAMGIESVASNSAAIALGQRNTATAAGSAALGGVNSDATANYAVTIGTNNRASGAYSMAVGNDTQASGLNATAMGFSVVAAGKGSLAFGLDEDATVSASPKPRVSGDHSAGFFFGDLQDGVDMTATKTMGLFGGRLIIDPAEPATELAASAHEDTGTLALDVEGYIGAVKYCDEDGNDCFTAASAGGSGSAVFEVTGAAGSEVVRQVAANAPIATADFVFGATSLTNQAGTDDDARMFFDKGQSAFRAGKATGTEWDTAGEYSAAFGNNTTASEIMSMAWGSQTLASGNASTAFGHNTTASGNSAAAWGGDEPSETAGGRATGRSSTAFGERTFASGLTSTAFGRHVSAGSGTAADGAGDLSVAIGLQSNSHTTVPKITGDRSMVLFFDGGVGNANSTYDFTANDKFAIIGGEFQIDNQSSTANKGCIRYNSADTKLEFSHNCTDYDEIAGAGSAVTVPGNDTEVLFNDNDALGTDTGFTYNKTTDSLTLAGDLTVTGDDITMGTNTAGHLLVADGTNFNPVALSGDATLSGTGALTIAADAIEESMLKAVDAPADEECLTYETTTGDFEWQDCDGGGSAVFEVTGAAGSEVVRQVAANAPIATSDFVFGSTQLDNDAGGTDDDSRMFFDKSKGAFRAGTSANTTIWNDGNVGTASVGLGNAPTASGPRSVAIGHAPVASGNGAVAIGGGVAARGVAATALGNNSNANGTNSFTLGRGVMAGTPVVGTGGEGSMAVGLGASSSGSSATDPRVSGNKSLGVFSGDQVSVDVNVDNVASFLGLKMIINPDTTSASPAVPATTGAGLELHVVGDIGAAQYCDEAGANCFTAAQAGLFEVTGAAGSEVVRQVAATAPIATSDFIFGGTSLTNQAGVDDDERMYFDKSKGAFRAGEVTGALWDDANVGINSTAFGKDTRATALYSMAWGNGARATGENSTAWGIGRATNTHAVAWGQGTASGTYSMAFGKQSTASADGSMSIALGTYSGTGFDTPPRITGAESIGIFMDNQKNVNISASRVMVLMGGRMGIGVTAPSVELDVSGDIEFTGTITDVSDQRLKTDIEPLAARGSMLEQIGRIKTYSFVMKDDEKKRTEFGVMAQDMQAIFPELVTKADDEMGTLSMNYMGLISPLINAAQELEAQNASLKAELDTLKARHAKMESSLEKLEDQVALLSRVQGQNVDKASMHPALLALLMLLLGGGASAALHYKRRAASLRS